MARHYYIADPYPDELIGSVLIRTARHRGLGNKALTALLSKSGQTKIPLLLSLQLLQIAEATRLTPRELLYEHTPFRFITAFMSKEVTEHIAEKLISGTYRSLAVLSQSVTLGARQPRYCKFCVREDSKTYGESYWHRKHNLPLVDKCHSHHQPLLQLSRTIDSFAICRPPAECNAVKVSPVLQGQVSEWLAHQSICNLHTSFRQRVEEWSTTYREIAKRRNFPSSTTGLCGKSLCVGLNAFYGEDFFKLHNCSFNMDGKSWPSFMLRARNCTEMTAAKHLILQGYLLHATVPPKQMTAKPGRKVRDYASLDELIAQKLATRMAQESIVGRPSARQLMLELEVWEIYRHSKQQLSATRALVDDWYRAYLILKVQE